jgi:hypothetical protein
MTDFGLLGGGKTGKDRPEAGGAGARKQQRWGETAERYSKQGDVFWVRLPFLCQGKKPWLTGQKALGLQLVLYFYRESFIRVRVWLMAAKNWWTVW